MTTAKHGAKQTVNALPVMTVTVMHGKMEMPSMENAHTSTDPKIKQQKTPQLVEEAQENMISTANVLTITRHVSNAIKILHLMPTELVRLCQSATATKFLVARVLNAVLVSTWTWTIRVFSYLPIALKSIKVESVLNVKLLLSWLHKICAF